MTISEPMTLITDYVLAAVTAWLAVLLFRNSESQTSRKCWAIAFCALALGAFLGGTWHGFLQNDILWKATVLSVGVATFGMIVGSAHATLGGSAFREQLRNAVIAAATLKLIVYSGWMLFRDDFIYVIADTGSAFIGVMLMHLWRFNGWILAGIAVSVAAALVQASGLALHPHFNHNDLYHVIQIAAMVLLYRGARALRDARVPTPAPLAAGRRP